MRRWAWNAGLVAQEGCAGWPRTTHEVRGDFSPLSYSSGPSLWACGQEKRRFPTPTPTPASGTKDEEGGLEPRRLSCAGGPGPNGWAGLEVPTSETTGKRSEDWTRLEGVGVGLRLMWAEPRARMWAWPRRGQKEEGPERGGAVRVQGRELS